MINRQILIRKAHLSDIKQIMVLGTTTDSFVTSENIDAFWPKEIVESCVTNNDAIVLIAELSGGIVGFVMCGVVSSMEKLHCENIFVAKEYRRRGIGTMLMDEVLFEAKKLGLRYASVLTNKAKEFTQAIGFEKGDDFTWYNLRLK